MTDLLKNYIHSYNIITLKGNKLSEEHARKCKQSFLDAEIDEEDIVIVDAVDGTKGEIPTIKGIKIHKHLVTKTEVACFLSHFLLWKKCVELERPIVILEHDARILRPLFIFPFSNCILYLGNESFGTYEHRLEQYVRAPTLNNLNVPEGSMDRSHAYAIDPLVANKMIIKTMENGIDAPVDHFKNISDFCIIQPVPMIATVDTSSSKAKEGETTVEHTGRGETMQVGWISPLALLDVE